MLLMRFESASFYKTISIWMKEVLFENRREVVFIWRSNVWKSSIMNAIFSKKDLVKTSSIPGKTRNANIFIVDNKYYFTDLPWYGFAKIWKELKKELDSLISWYFDEKKESIKLVVLLIDSKLWVQESDIEMYKYLLELGLPIVIVLSKIDKVSSNLLNENIKKTKEIFYWQEVIAVSSKTKNWLRDLSSLIKNSLIW